MEPTQMKFSSAIFRDETVGVVENAHGDVLMYNPSAAQAIIATNILKWDGNDPIIVDLDLEGAEDALKLFEDNRILEFNVQDPEYGGVYEEIKFYK